MAKYSIVYFKSFVKDYKKLNAKEQVLVDEVITSLANDENLSAKYKDHQLKGELKDFRECHVKPDLLLIYEKEENILLLSIARVGSHSQLFKK